MSNEPFVIERKYDAPVERVWQAITDKDKMKSWYFDIKDFRAEEGFEFEFIGEDGDCNKFVHKCKIIEVVPNRKLKHSWRYEGYVGESFVTWELFPNGNGTKVMLTHEGLETFPAEVKAFAKQNFVAGWTEITGKNLKEFVEEKTIEKSVEINATKAKIWQVLTDLEYGKQWANEFSEGAYWQTDWHKNSEVLWFDKDGNLGTKGIVIANEPEKLLEVTFYDDMNDSQPGKYTESYALSGENGKTTLTISAGPLSVKDANGFWEYWDKAIAKMKELAEEK